MNLILTRDNITAASTEGHLSVNGEPECVTLELPVRDGLPGSAIPPGKYLITLAESPKFSRSTDLWVQRFAYTIPHIMGIPGRSDILIHWGNSPEDTEGCILVGQQPGDNVIGNSRVAFEALWNKLMAARRDGEAISIEVQGGIPSMGPVPTLGVEE